MNAEPRSWLFVPGDSEKKILKALKKTYSTNGTILVDEELGEIIQLQG